jgi:hypothetical protein
MPHRKAKALSALIAGSAKLRSREREAIISELREVTKLKQLAPHDRRNLFQLIHAVRACDSSMAGIIKYHGASLASPSMGTYLMQFRNIAALPFNERHRQYYQKRLVRRRNALIICPMRKDSQQLQFNDHNLWMVDDRLPFFKFFASDVELKKYCEARSDERPDLAFFYDACLAWREGENTDTVVIVEFKRPMRTDYSHGRDPVSQVLLYVELLKQGSVLTPTGQPIQGISSGTAFHCYIIADITPQLRESFIGRFRKTPDGLGYFGYTNDPDAFVEIIPFNKILANARMRNIGSGKARVRGDRAAGSSPPRPRTPTRCRSRGFLK